jgi:hypothetical protein
MEGIYRAADRSNFTTRAARVVDVRGRLVFAFESTAHPAERCPQWTHRRKMAPGSHQTPYS